VRISLRVSLAFGLATTLFAHIANGAPCVVDAETASVAHVAIQPAGEEAFSFSLEHLPMEARLTGSNDATLHVTSPLRFTTTHAWNRLGVVTRKRTVLFGGRLVIPQDLGIRFAGGEHDVDGDVLPAALPLQELVPTKPIAIPCDALTLPRDVVRLYETPELLRSETKILFATTSKEFPLYSSPKARAPWLIKFHGPLRVLRTSGDWIKVQAKWAGGSVLQGWALSEHFSIQDAVPTAGGSGLGSIGMGHCGSSHRRAPAPFVLRANAPIHSGPKGAIWAHTAGKLRVHAFALARSDGWMQVVRVPGFPKQGCREHNKIWVHADSVQWTDAPID
jgi:hypothetical protein